MEAAWVALGLSLKVALWATAIDLVLGVAAGFALARYRFPGRELVDSILLLPMVLPPTVLGYYLLVVIGRRGWLGGWLERSFGINLIFTWQGAVIAAASSLSRLQVARAAFEKSTQPSSRQCSARPGGVLPLTATGLAGILAGVLLAFARALGEFGATLMVAGSIPGKTQTLSIAVYEAVQAGQDELANGLVLLTSVTCIAILLLAGRLAPARIPGRS